MKRVYPASALWVSLLIASGLLLIVFYLKQDIFSRDHYTQNRYQDYLTDKFKLINEMKKDKNQLNKECYQAQSPVISVNYSVIQYRFSCVFNSIFKQDKPTKKYTQIKDIHQWLDIERYREQIYYISSFTELPDSSPSNPKIVIALNAIDENLTTNFYGIVITDYYFDIKGKRIYGALYSAYPNQREERNLTYSKEVINEIERQFSYWDYLPYSRNLLANE